MHLKYGNDDVRIMRMGAVTRFSTQVSSLQLLEMNREYIKKIKLERTHELDSKFKAIVRNSNSCTNVKSVLKNGLLLTPNRKQPHTE
ncbi:unnamed protein product [Ambrosiozyma monospora]|uniref:Unnamed protein product n=1 Tax=Ambrosiozyma monospora TaxID=43982 RepID=A0A9W6Z257_AMBMO|nr:unnamed protein product [Ambrosiozyma monospora]